MQASLWDGLNVYLSRRALTYAMMFYTLHYWFLQITLLYYLVEVNYLYRYIVPFVVAIWAHETFTNKLVPSRLAPVRCSFLNTGTCTLHTVRLNDIALSSGKLTDMKYRWLDPAWHITIRRSVNNSNGMEYLWHECQFSFTFVWPMSRSDMIQKNVV